MKGLIFFIASISVYAFEIPKPKPGFDWKPLELIAVQQQGRVKPFDTYAREATQYLTGKVIWKGWNASEFLISLLTSYETTWENVPFIRVTYVGVKKKLGLDTAENFFSPKQLKENAFLPGVLQEVNKKNQRREKLNDEDKKFIQIQNQVGWLDLIIRGEEMNVFPNPTSVEGAWLPIGSILDSSRSILPYPNDKKIELSNLFKKVLSAYLNGDPKTFNEEVGGLTKLLKSLSPFYPSENSLKRERLYNHLRPFRLSWMLYALAFILLVSYLVTESKLLKPLSFSVLLLGFGVHTYGFILRMVISGRPPVTNMYESVIWVTWGCLLFSLLIWLKYKKFVIPTAATVFSIVGLILADNLPFVLDPNIHPLEPVLRSNFWLTIHVLTITLSYAAFALSLCLGNVVLGSYLLRPTKLENIQYLTLYMYRAIQIGVVLLAAGTILGGVWADYSWGRFWGWDPKEVWALIALLLYLAVLHGRFAGWLKGFGFVVTTVLSFLGVLMAWYGVNFVLGVGLHSYGFGTGGLQYVMGYLIAQLALILASYLKYRSSGAKHTTIFPKK